jgi:outer membrane protein OmpA-like peptidoglycan-associated protein
MKRSWMFGLCFFIQTIVVGQTTIMVNYSNTATINDLSRGLIAHLPFNEDANDAVGKSHGKVHGAKLTEGRCGNKAYYFNGESDYIDCGNDMILNGNFTGLTISVWVKPKFIVKKEFGTIVGKWGFDPVKDHFGMWINENYKIVMAVGDQRKMEAGIFSGTHLDPESWYHVVGVWKRNREMEIFIDGRIDNRGRQTGHGINLNSPLTLKIGRQIDRKDRPFRGHIDEVRIYNRPLSSSEVRLLYELGRDECEKIILRGQVLNKNTMDPVAAEVVFENLVTGMELKRVSTQGEECAYETILPLNQKIAFYANAEGFLPINENINTSNFLLNQVVTRDLYVVPIEAGQSITLNNISFDFNKATLTSESFPELNRLVKILGDNPDIRIEIAGHTDGIGSDTYNLKLSQDRANTVREYLLQSRIRESNVLAIGYGKKEPIASNDTEEGRQLNRRVEFRVLGKGIK